jgi:dipeptidyl aminopeptidase/acylaminoacyl peptidase
MRGILIQIALGVCLPLQLLRAEAFDAAKAFGARPSVSNLTLSPNGENVAYVAPGDGPGSRVFVVNLVAKKTARLVMNSDGKPMRIHRCDWVSNDRLVCALRAIVRDPTAGLAPVTRIVAINADGSNIKVLSNQTNSYSRGYLLRGGEVIDWLPDQDGAVLMTRQYVPDTRTGSRMGSDKEGLGVDLVDTRTLRIKQVEIPRHEALDYISDGRGNVRLMALRQTRAEEDKPSVSYEYRTPGSEDWRKLSDWDSTTREGFLPEAVDPTLNVAYGFKKKDGRLALYSVSLDGSLHEELIFAHPDVDVDELIRIGRRQRVVGLSYATDRRLAHYFAPDISALLTSLGKALPQQPQVHLTESSVDENTMLVFAGGDTDPGVYYILDRKARHMETFLVVRAELEGVKLAKVKPVSYPAADGVMIPGYLTLPPGRDTAQGLPAIVMPHGGPADRDEWGFDWLPQYFASQGFAVLQPNFRGSSGYGDAWFEKNGFRSWEIAVGDVNAGGRWLVSRGIADPGKLAIVGWSYGGYAALQSAVVDPGLFKAVVAIAPVTDLGMLIEEHRGWSDFALVSESVGSGPQLHAGSPAEHADRISAPVLMFHGAFDRNVSIEESKHMARRLTAAGKTNKLVTWEDLDHQLDDSSARATMLRTSDEFLRNALGLAVANPSRVSAAGEQQVASP